MDLLRRFPLFSRRTTALFAALFLLVTAAFIVHLALGKSPSSFSPAALVHNSPPSPDFWEWETPTRFAAKPPPRHNILPGGGGGDDNDLCATFPKEILSRVQITSKIGVSEPKDRIDAHFSTTTRCIDNLLVVSDHEADNLHGHKVHNILARLPESFRSNISDFRGYEPPKQGDTKPAMDSQQGWNLDRFKFLPMVELAFEVNPSASWFVFLESDTYFVWDNLFRLLDNYSPQVPLYFGSPSPGRGNEHDQTTWFAYGGAGIVLSRAAVEKLVARKAGALGDYVQPTLSEQYKEVLRGDPCGDSVLGWALYEAGVKLSGLWPMFNPHPLHGIPFDHAYWCQPVITMHKTIPGELKGLMKWENQRDRTHPLLYADLFSYLSLGTLAPRPNWDNGDWGGWQEPPDNPGHASFQACGKACHDHGECLAYTYDSTGHCIFIRTVRAGSKKLLGPDVTLSAGWDNEKIMSWKERFSCPAWGVWVKPSITRIF